MTTSWTRSPFATPTLGCAGLLSAYRADNVTLSNAISTGIADDKSVYPYVPKMIEFYLGEKAILANVPTSICREAEATGMCSITSASSSSEVHGAGGYGMLVGPAATTAEIEAFASPGDRSGALHRAADAGPVHLSDLRSRAASRRCRSAPVRAVRPGRYEWCGLTRVALKEGSLVVNSSQGGGTKDTWILEA